MDLRLDNDNGCSKFLSCFNSLVNRKGYFALRNATPYCLRLLCLDTHGYSLTKSSNPLTEVEQLGNKQTSIIITYPNLSNSKKKASDVNNFIFYFHPIPFLYIDILTRLYYAEITHEYYSDGL